MITRSPGRRVGLVALLLASACSARNCDNVGLQVGLGGGGDAGAGEGGVAGAMQGGGGTGGAPGMDCDDDGVSEDLANDPAHCGACLHQCNVIAECVQGNCVVASEAGLMPQGIHADDGKIYFVGASNGALTIFELDEEGSALTPHAASSAIGIAVGMDLHVWNELATVNVPDPATLLGFTAWALVDDLMNPLVQPDENPVFVDGEDQRVCWLIAPPAAPAIRCRTGSTVHDTIALASPAYGLSLVGAAIHWSDEDGLLWRSDPNPDAASPAMFDAAIPGVGPLVVSGGNAYVVTSNGIWRAPVSNAPGEMIVEGPIVQPWDVIVVGSTIYWTTLGDAETRAGLFRAPAAGGAAERLYTADAFNVSGYLTTAGTYVFFGMFNEDRVLRHAIGSDAFADPP